MAFTSAPIPHRLTGHRRRPSRKCRRLVTASAPAKGKFAKRTHVQAIDVPELTQIARDTENSVDGVKVLALHARAQCEIIEVGGTAGPLRIVWPLSAPAWPFNAANPNADEAGDTTAAALLATTRLESNEKAQIVLSRIRGHLRDGLDCGELFAGVVLVDADDPSLVHVLSVHDPEEGVLFDSELGGADWRVARYTAVHPPLADWRAAASAASLTVDDHAHTVSVASRRATKPETKQVSTPWAKFAGDPQQQIPEGPGELAKESDFAPKTRMIFGAGALDGLAIKMREVGQVKDGEATRVYGVAGWNQARIQPFTIECETPIEHGYLKLVVGGRIDAGSVTINAVRRAIEKYRETNGHVVVGFGGGAVMDGTKAIAALAAQPPIVVEEAFEEIEAAARRGQREASITLPLNPLPAILINGTVGTGASLSESILFSVESKDARQRVVRHSLFVTINYAADVKRSERERMAIVDSRIVASRRLNSQDTAQGGLLALCTAIDTALSSRASPQALELALDSLHHGADYILQARRDPTHSDGPSRDYLLRAACGAALARDALGAPPLGLMLTVGLMDALVDGAVDGEFRWTYVRVMVSIIRKCCPLIAVDDVLLKAATATLHDEGVDGNQLADWLLDYAERFAVPQLRMIGLTRRRAHQVAKSLAQSGAIRAPPHPVFDQAETLVDIVDDVLDNQPFQIW